MTGKVKLSPVQSVGDCGYHTVIIGLFYLALKAREDEKIASVINVSDTLSKLLAAQPGSLKKCLVKPFKTNQECLLSYLDAMAATGFEQLTFNEILSNFTSQLKRLNCDSDWLEERVKNEIKSGLWLETNRAWEKLPSFKKIMKKIQMKADELYEKAIAVNPQKPNDDLLFEIMFQAQIEACDALTDEELILSAKEVISHFYAVDAPKAWLDDAFLKRLVTHLLGSSNIMFDKDSVKITGEGPNNNHWYIELPNDECTQKFISIYKTGYHSGLTIVLPGTKVEIALSSYSSLFPPATKIDKTHDPESLFNYSV
ncbi:Uncharacterised protein [Legionella lansingensis]|uniref:Dot/Icm T4SS effector n=2 Tax=Legionella lansingensis TaxID=45067 RepID=A0A0W0VRZ4_9GAMM|nr:hypothetical protein [Legionella lansingensis]KTD22831.1 hypothetical protein Llan_1072 [Legionella lansingensis]SNV49647.1 Uncharacterised protein [Legionella lansingensis]